MPKLMPKVIRDLRYKLFYGMLLSRRFPVETLGDLSYGVQWSICPDVLNSGSIVYSGGVGEDISFEHALVRRFGCDVILLDPSPTGVETMAKAENLSPKLKFLQMALSANTGTIRLAPPREGEISWYAKEQEEKTIEVPSTDLLSLMNKFGHKRIDLLKLDIEGCEYEVIDHILANRLSVRQICADFDYGYVPGVRRSQAIRAMLKLTMRGYRLIKQEGANHTFILPAAG